jgi:hypothetical protein
MAKLQLGIVEARLANLGNDALALHYVGIGMQTEGDGPEMVEAGSAVQRIAARFKKKIAKCVSDLDAVRTIMEGPADGDRALLDLWRKRQTILTALAADRGDVPDDDPRLAEVASLTEKIAATPVCTLVGAITVLCLARDLVNEFRGVRGPEDETADARMIRHAVTFLDVRYEAGGGQKASTAD